MARGGAVVDVASKAEYDAAVAGAAGAAVHFWARWCEPCAHMDGVFAALAAETPAAAFLRVEAEELPEVSEQCGVAAVPFFLFYKNGAVVDRLEGASPPELAHKVATHIANAQDPPAGTLRPPAVAATAAGPEVIEAVASSSRASEDNSRGLSDTLRRRLTALVNSSPVILFMKGTPEEPRCGFSSKLCATFQGLDEQRGESKMLNSACCVSSSCAKVVAALDEEGVPFETFDILSDSDVRAGLKEFSDWPTYPQLYCRGELVGSSDIVLEMHRSGELAALLRGEKASNTANGGAGSMEEALTPAESAEDRCRRLLVSQQTMLFMKGTPDDPRCGFSSKVVTALRGAGVDFGYFDILTDDDVRNGLKKLSDWPTYPQLYHGGELVGGCDIVMEMQRSGELKEVLSH
eukprot:SM000104S09337  [mRNA]  locus=s104:125652:128030:- [translate_table: standard]